MFRCVSLVLFGVAVALTAGGRAGAAPVPKHLAKEPEADKAKFQGKWKVESMKMGDQDILKLVGADFEMIIEFQGNQMLATATIQGMALKSTATVKYDPAKKQLNVTNTQTVGADGKPINVGQKEEGAMGYAFDGEKLLVASNPGGNGAADPLKPGKNDSVMVLVRVK